MGYWKSKVLPKIKKVFDKTGPKKAAAAEACKSFDDSKEEIIKEFEEKKAELEPKVLEIYEAASSEIKTLVKGPTDEGVKKNSAEVTKFIQELEKIEFPGSKLVSTTFSKYGPALASGPVLFIFEKVATFIPAEPESHSKDVVIEGEAKKESEVKVEEETTPPPAVATVATAAEGEETPKA